jgi:hypothetical protein
MEFFGVARHKVPMHAQHFWERFAADHYHPTLKREVPLIVDVGQDPRRRSIRSGQADLPFHV